MRHMIKECFRFAFLSLSLPLSLFFSVIVSMFPSFLLFQWQTVPLTSRIDIRMDDILDYKGIHGIYQMYTNRPIMSWRKYNARIISSIIPNSIRLRVRVCVCVFVVFRIRNILIPYRRCFLLFCISTVEMVGIQII